MEIKPGEVSKKKPDLRWWSVPYRATVQGTTQVEAESAEAARAQVEAGGFELDAGQEIVDWEATGPAREEP